MAFADLTAFNAGLGDSAYEEKVSFKGYTGQTASRWYSCWMSTPDAAATPTSTVAPTRTTQGALGQSNAGTGSLYLTGAELDFTGVPTSGTLIVADRLSQIGGLNATTITAQTTSTASLTRYTSGVGVMVGLEIYTQIGSTATTITMSYTNQAGTSGQTSPAITFGGTGFRELGRIIVVPLAAGDTGVRTVASVTVLSTTGTAGNFGVTLFKPLAVLPFFYTSESGLRTSLNGGIAGGIPEVIDDAALFFMATANGTGAGTIAHSLTFAEA